MSTSSTDHGGTEADRLLEVGHVARAHGLRGQVVVELTTNRSERVQPGAFFDGPDGRLVVTESSPLPAVGGRGRWLVGFAGVNNREGADQLRGQILLAAPLEDPDALWVHELIGSVVVDAGAGVVGTVEAVEANPASDLLVLDGGQLIPLRFVTDRSPGRVVVDLPAGLLEL